MTAGSDRTALVIGAGIVGVCCALPLQRSGVLVTLIDQGSPGEQDSFGNAGVIGTSYIFPAATPAMLRNLPKMLADPEHPLVVRMRAVPGLVRWFRQFLDASRHTAENIASAAALHASIRRDWDDVLQEAQARELVHWTGMLEACETSASLAGARAAWQTMRDYGFKAEELRPEEICELEPAVSTQLAGGAILRDCGFTVDPLALTRQLFARFLSLGGQFISDRVKSIIPVDQSTCSAIGNRATYASSTIVIAAGIQSLSLAGPFSRNLTMAAERGYHVMINQPSVVLGRPITAVDRKVVIAPMATGLRMTTMAEFTSPDAPPDYPRAERILRRAMPVLPGLAWDVSSRWVGSRPSTPNSLPVIGRSPAHSSVLFAFGHGSRGLTLAPTTGRMIADEVSGVFAGRR